MGGKWRQSTDLDWPKQSVLYIENKGIVNGQKLNIFKSVGLVSLFNGISTILGYLMPKPFSEKNSSGTI